MRIVLTGATGFLGRPLAAYLTSLGYECIIVTRNPARAATLGLPPSVQLASVDALPAAEAIIHLAGESIVGYWTPRKRRAILASRVDGTRRLVDALRRAKTRPHTLLSASAVGIYGHRPGELLDETAAADPQRSFRAEVCEAWEDAANAADRLGVRVVNLRIGNVLDPEGGYLGGLLPLYRWLGGWMWGDADAAIPWISRTDAVRLIGFAVANERWYGPLNVVAPEAITHRDLALAMSERWGRRGVHQVPAFLTRTVLGEFSSALMDDQRVVPAKALAAGFGYQHGTFGTWVGEAFSRTRTRTKDEEDFREPASSPLLCASAALRETNPQNVSDRGRGRGGRTRTIG